MIWLEFLASAALIVYAATKLAQYGDVIAVRTRLGGMFVGTLLMAAATSLPELLTAINAIDQGVPNLTAGNIFGSTMFNMFLLGLIDLLFFRLHILRRITVNHALSATVAVLLTGLAVFFIVAQIDVTVGWVGADSLVLMGVYVLGTRLMFGGVGGADSQPAEPDAIPDGLPSLRYASIGFALATAALIALTPMLVSSSVDIAEITGLGTGFIGVALVAIVTSLPEVITTIAAARIGAYDLAVGNLFGSNVFNIFALALTDLFYTDGRFLAAVSSTMTIAGTLGLIMITLALLGTLARNLAWGHTRRLIVELDALAIMVLYLLGMLLLYNRGLIG